MSFLHVCSFITPIDSDVRARDLPNLLRVLRPVFAPCELSYKFGDAAIETLHASERPTDALWTGEVKTDERLTAYMPGAEEKVVADFESAVADRDDTTVWMNVIGPLFHRAPGTATSRWYGHWRIDGGVHELVELRLTAIDAQLHELELLFPLIGYPLTASRLEDDRVVEGDTDAAKANREAIVPLIAQLRTAIGLSPGNWNIDGEFDFDYPSDYEAIKHMLAKSS
jgi:hypothetical protein